MHTFSHAVKKFYYFKNTENKGVGGSTKFAFVSVTCLLELMVIRSFLLFRCMECMASMYYGNTKRNHTLFVKISLRHFVRMFLYEQSPSLDCYLMVNVTFVKFVHLKRRLSCCLAP